MNPVSSIITGFVVGAVLSVVFWYFMFRRIDRKVEASLAGHRREIQRTRDEVKARYTERNIGNRFAKLVRSILSESRFIIESRSNNREDHGGYFITVWPKRGGERLFTMTVHLDYVDDSQVCGTMGPNNIYKSAIDENSLASLYQQVAMYLSTL